MIRIIFGILILFGVAGALDDMPPNPSWSYIAATITLVVAGFGLAFSGVRSIQR